MDERVLEEKLMEILADINDEILDYDGDNLFDDGIIDSFQVMDIVNDIEDAFDIDIDAKYVVEENFCTKEAIIGLITMIMND